METETISIEKTKVELSSCFKEIKIPEGIQFQIDLKKEVARQKIEDQIERLEKQSKDLSLIPSGPQESLERYLSETMEISEEFEIEEEE